MTTQEKLNDLALEIAVKIRPSSLYHEGHGGSIFIDLYSSDYGNIGISTENSEISVYGLGGHEHFTSDTNEYCEISLRQAEIQDLISDLLSGNTFYYLAINSNGDSLCGGYGTYKNGKYTVSHFHQDVDSLIITRHGEKILIVPINDSKLLQFG